MAGVGGFGGRRKLPKGNPGTDLRDPGSKVLAARARIEVEPDPPTVLPLPGGWSVFWLNQAIFLTNSFFGGLFLVLGRGVTLFARANSRSRIRAT